MELLIKYPGIQKVMQAMKLQILESIPYAQQHFYGYSDPADLFTALRERLTYQDDPKGKEYIQTLKTLLEKNNGYGDCDCFSVAAASCLCVNGFRNIIILASNDSRSPTHVYNGVEGVGNTYTSFDLTEDYYGSERIYKYHQFLPVKI